MSAARGPVLVTGASGFIGRHVVAELRAHGYTVRTLHRGGPLPGLEAAHTAADVLAPEARAAAAAAGAVVHLAGRGNVDEARERPFEYNAVNALGTLNVLEGARQGGARVVLASSQRVYQPGVGALRELARVDPLEPYGVSKLVAEEWCRLYARVYGVLTVALRIFSVYGPGQQPQGSSGVLAIFAHRALAGEPVYVRSRVRRDFVHVGDVARAFRRALEADLRPGACYNVGTGVGTSLPELARLLLQVTGSRSPIVLELTDPESGDRVADPALASRELGFDARIPLADGVQSYVDWLRAHG